MRRFFAAVLVLMSCGFAAAAEMKPVVRPTSRPSVPTTSRADYGKDVIVMSELVDMYEAVPFEHRKHAEMAEMWDGCETCHHHSPTTRPTTQAVTTARSHAPTQDDAAVIPACKSCHSAKVNPTTEIRMPSLKGAYHRQCLNCHREWTGANACVMCHAARGTTGPTTMVTPDDIVGRMHKPIPAPTTKLYVTRFTPVAGPNVMFRHDEHVKDFGVKCVSCHRHDTCVSCHAPTTTHATTTRTQPPVQPGKTWRESHSACVSCHENDRCAHCHYAQDAAPPPPFTHAGTGQALDKDHEKLACGQCHKNYKDSKQMTCGDASCHKRPVTLPTDRPGPFRPIATKPATTNTTQVQTTRSATQPATRPVIIRIRRGGV